MDLEQIIQLSKILSKPYKIACFVLSILLVISIFCNVYLATQQVEVIFDADENVLSTINQKN